MNISQFGVLVAATCLASACQTLSKQDNQAIELTTTKKTNTSFADIADAAVWENPNNNKQQWLIAALEEDGLAVFNAAGELTFQDKRIEPVSVDLRYQVADEIDVAAVALSDEEAIGFYAINPKADQPLSAIGKIQLPFEPSAACLYKDITTGATTATAVSEEGAVVQYKLTYNNSKIYSYLMEDDHAKPVREFNVGGELSACAIDDQQGTLFVAEQNVAIWAYGADVENVKERRLVDAVEPLGHLEEIEGLDLVYGADQTGYLIAADEGKGLVVYQRTGKNDYLATVEVAGFDEIKVMASATSGLWLGNSELSDPVYEFLSYDKLNQALPAGAMTSDTALAHNALTVTGVHLAKATGETKEVDDDGDAADDSAFWFNENNPSKSLIIATNKQAGLMAYDLNGNELQYLEEGEPNNVDLRSGIKTADGKTITLAAASNRDLNTISLYQIQAPRNGINPITPILATGANVNEEGQELQSNLDEVYGLCMFNDNGQAYVFINGKSGQVEQWQIIVSNGVASGVIVREFAVDSQPEGCVVDDATAQLYLGEEDVGIWQFDAHAAGATNGKAFAMIDGKQMVADVEGLTLYQTDGQNYLIASSQGNNTYAVFDLDNNNQYVGSFAIIGNDAKGVDGASDTDGIEAYAGYISEDYPEGIFIAQDWYNINDEYSLENQNFKYVSWREIRGALN